MTEKDHLTCITVDDEPMALKLLDNYIRKVPFLKQIGAYRDAIEALNDLHNIRADLIFLDINMPDITGIQFLKTLTYKPMIVFTTAYSEFAVESYDYEAVDYLLKPIEFERFLKAANKAYDLFVKDTARRKEVQPSGSEVKDSVIIKSGSDYFNVKIQDILYVEGTGNYVTFVTGKKKILSLMNMKEVLELVGGHRFVRIHKSFIVSFRHVDLIETEKIRIGGKELPIGETYKKDLRDFVKNS